MSDKTGGPAFPNGPGGDSWHHEDGRVSHQWPAHPGMDLLDWFAGQETLAEFDHPDASYGDKLAFSFAGPKPTGGWPEDPRGMFEWEANVRAGMKYTRASAMLAEKARRQAADHSGDANKMVPDHSPDAGKMAKLEVEIRELVEELESLEVWGDELDANISPPDRNCSCHINPPCNDCVDFTGQREAKMGWKDAKSKARTILAKHQTPKKEVGHE